MDNAKDNFITMIGDQLILCDRHVVVFVFSTEFSLPGHLIFVPKEKFQPWFLRSITSLQPSCKPRGINQTPGEWGESYQQPKDNQKYADSSLEIFFNLLLHGY